MSKTQASSGNLLGRCFRAPYRALRRARDLYIRSMTGCAGRMHYGGAMVPISYPSTSAGNMSRSGSLGGRRISSSDEDLVELIRAASQSRARDAAAAAEGSVRRSQSVAAVRIDEDAPYEFPGEVKVGGSLIFPRSQSHAAGRRMAASAVAWRYK